uniref:Pigment-dispersing hormone peptides n=1 Tax=Eurydice pulchra TaxID=155694 RepID=PDH_EURPU|nr:RecName: Full=Pigment-dispersing hormone peptides; Contains: RecName: Full=PDH precursor-related peptide; Short=PPRP; Contains: RecName: Full=Pigment-dispersing hormone; Short=PDH; Flags: Precursor [Eurydice pulchra]ACX49752.1 prepro-pigment dispersing hormone [Eurydice pulchra]
MRFIILGVLFIAVASMILSNGVMAQSRDFSISEREIVASLAKQLLRVARMGYVPEGDLPRKRNAELINSLLGVPRVMSDAGRR